MIQARNTTLGICAHVDAGKTTLSEGLLYLGGSIRKMGRVDTRDAFLDTDEMERSRGITIFSKQAQLTSARDYTLLDTPGHADFSPEMERTLQVLDLAVLVISAADGVNAQVKTLWSLLKHYGVPTVIFVNKMDQMENLGEGETRRAALLAELQEELHANCLPLAPYTESGSESSALLAQSRANGAATLNPAGKSHAQGGAGNSPAQDSPASPQDAAREALANGETRRTLLTFLGDADLQENLALCDEALLNRVMEGEPVTPEDVQNLVAERKLFPVFFGSALKMQGVGELLAGLDLYAPIPVYPEEFSARIFKITRDGRERLTWMKITGGSIAVRKELTYNGRKPGGEAPDGEEAEESGGAFAEKITQIRLYSGDRFTPLPEAGPGCVCAVCGLTATYAGQGLGANATENTGLVVPVLTWQILLPQGTDPFKAYKDLCVLEEEEPMLQVAYNERKREITACVMGEIQREVLKKIVKERFDLEIAFGRPSIIYKETIAEPVEGVGHFEPLRHYAEVHLLLEPGEPGSGLVFESKCSVDSLSRNWQRLVLTHLRERRHKGVLTGSEITDMKITLIGGRAHEKHTEGGDFRQATYRAVRQGLMMAKNVLLEPYYNFRLELPQGNLGRALTDLQQMGASFAAPDLEGGDAILIGSAPVSVLGDYAEQLGAYTKGRGRLVFEMGGYRPCHNMEETVAEFGYDPETDKRNPTSSVFCSHGAGMIVPWYQVRDYMHVDTGWKEGMASSDGMFSQSGASRTGAHLSENDETADSYGGYGAAGLRAGRAAAPDGDARSFKERERDIFAAEDELRSIFERTYGPIKPNVGQSAANVAPRRVTGEAAPKYRKPKPRPEKEYLLVDGYNIIFAWETLRELAARDIKAARDALMDRLSNYAGFVKRSVICVFDAYKVSGGTERVYRYHNIDVIFTREAETADLYIERAAHELSRRYQVTVATSDAIEQIIIYGAGAVRLSARNFLAEVEAAEREMKAQYIAQDTDRRQTVGSSVGEEIRKAMK